MKNIILSIFCFLPYLLVAQYTASPSSITANGDCCPSWGGNVLEMSVNTSSSSGSFTFTVSKQNNGSFTTPGTMYLRFGSPNGSNSASDNVLSGNFTSVINYNFSSLSASSFPLNVYAYYRIDANNWAWTGPITINYSTPSVSNVSPTTATLGQSQTFTISGNNLTNSTAWYIPDFGSGIVNFSSSTTTKTFTTIAQNSAGLKTPSEIKTGSGGTILETFSVAVYFPTPSAPNLSVQGDQHINVSWSSVPASGTYQYRLYRNTTNNISGATQIYCGNSTSRTDSGTHLSAGTTYYYWVRFLNNGDNCNTSNPAYASNYSPSSSATTTSTTPSVSNVSPTTATLGQATTFTINGTNLTNTTAWHIQDFGDGTVNYSTNTNTKTFTSTPNNSAGVKSDGVIKTTSGGITLENFSVNVYFPTPPAPNLSVQGSQSINTSWSSVPASGNFQYRLYRNTVNNSSTATQIHCADNSTSYPDNGNHLSPNTTYYYWIRYANYQDNCGVNNPSFISAFSPSSAVTTTIADSDGNTIPQDAILIPLDDFLNGNIADENDTDWYKVEIPFNGTLGIATEEISNFNSQFRVFTSQIASYSGDPNTTTLYTVDSYDPVGNENPANDNGTSQNEWWVNIDVSPGTYYIKVALQNLPITYNNDFKIYADYLRDPVMLAPTNGATDVSITPSIQVENYSATDTRIQCKDDTNYGTDGSWNAMAVNTNIGAADSTIPTPDLATNTIYYTRVRTSKPMQLEGATHTIQSAFTNSWSFTTGVGITCAQECPSFPDVADLPAWAYCETQYLCGENVVNGDDITGTLRPQDDLNRAELAKMIFLAIDLETNSYVSSTVKYFPNPFYDLQLNYNSWYHDYALSLSYLEYGDCKPVFDRTFFNFKPSNPIERQHTVKAIVEAWDLPIQTSTTSPFIDVNTSDEFFPYIYTAYANGIISGDGGGASTFRPTDYVMRAESFVMLHNAMQSGLPNVVNNDFHEPGNYSPSAFGSASSNHSGNFNHYSRPSFIISSIGLPLNFTHNYNSYLAEMPKEFFAIEPLGNGWTHSYNSYVMEIEGDVFSATPDDRIVIMLPGGTFLVFNEIGGQFVAETAGVYSELTRPNSYTYRFTTKSQIVYEFVKLSGVDPDFPFVLTSVKDRNNNTLSISYENGSIPNRKRISQVTGTAGRTLQFTYQSGTDRVYRITDPLNRYVQYGYTLGQNNKMNLTSYRNPNGNNTSYNYGNDYCTAHQLESIQLPKGNTITSGYDGKRRLASVTKGGINTTFAYSMSYNTTTPSVTQTATIDGNYDITSQFNEYGRMTNSNSPYASSTVSYDTGNNVTMPASVTANSSTSSYTYDSNGNLLTASLPEGVNYTFTYNGFNDMDSYMDGNGQTYNMGYNGNGNLTTYTTPRGSTTFGRANNGLLTSVTNPENITVSYSHNTYGNVIGVQAPMGINSTATYDAASRLINSVDPTGLTTSLTYDNNSNVLSSSYGSMTQYNYDLNDNLTSITNPNGGVTNMTYDFAQDLHTETDFGGASDNYTYDDDGRIQTHTTPTGVVFTYNYDTQKRLSSMTSSSGNITYGYDSRDRITSVTNSNGAISFTYDNLNRIISTTDFYSNTVEYTYDNNSNVTSIEYSDGKIVNYVYYNDNLLQSVTDWNGNTTSYTYLDDGRLSSVSNPNGTSCSYTYDAAARNTIHTWTKSNGDVICTYTRTFDNASNITSENETQPIYPTFPAAMNIGGTYNIRNEAQTYGPMTFSHKADGTMDAIASSSGNTNYTFNDYEQLTQVVTSSLNLQYAYDGAGIRRQKTQNGVVTRYVMDMLGMGNVLQETDGSNNIQNYYVYGLGLVSRVKPDGSTRYYHGDYRGSVVAMTDESANITHQYAYGPFGESWGDEVEEDFNPFRYVGMYGVQYESDELYFMRARYYNPEIGRFISEDPIWHLNLYIYADNNPIKLIDPLGANSFSSGKNNEYKSNEQVNLGESNVLCILNDKGGGGFVDGHTWIDYTWSDGTNQTYSIWGIEPSQNKENSAFKFRDDLYVNVEKGRGYDSKKCVSIDKENEDELEEYLKVNADSDYRLINKNVCTNFSVELWNEFTEQDINHWFLSPYYLE